MFIKHIENTKLQIFFLPFCLEDINILKNENCTNFSDIQIFNRFYVKLFDLES